MSTVTGSLRPLSVTFVAGLLAACGGREGLEIGNSTNPDPMGAPAPGGAGGAFAAGGLGGSPPTAPGGNDGSGVGWGGAEPASGGNVNGSAGSASVGGAPNPPTLPSPEPTVAVDPPAGWMPGPTLCTGIAEVDALDVWSDDRGVFVLVVGLGWEGIFAKRDSDWELFAEAGAGTTSMLTRLTGFVGGPLVRHGYGGWGGTGCAIQFIAEDGSYTCSTPGGVSRVFTVQIDLAYGLAGNYVSVYDGTYWLEYVSGLSSLVPEAGSVGVSDLWANQDVLLLGASAGVLFLVRQGQVVVQRPDMAFTGVYTAVWGFDGNDLWAGRDDGALLQYDGASWQQAFSGAAGCDRSRVQQMWGSEGVVVFRTDSEVWMIEADQARRVYEVPCSAGARITAIWGNSRADVFITVDDADAASTECGAARVLRFDGARVHAL